MIEVRLGIVKSLVIQLIDIFWYFKWRFSGFKSFFPIVIIKLSTKKKKVIPIASIGYYTRLVLCCWFFNCFCNLNSSNGLESKYYHVVRRYCQQKRVQKTYFLSHATGHAFYIYLNFYLLCFFLWHYSCQNWLTSLFLFYLSFY